MSFFVLENGEIRCDTPSEALALRAQILRIAAGTPTSARGADKPHKETAEQKRQRAQRKQSLAFLVAVKEAGTDGIGGEPLVRKTGCNGRSGLGTAVTLVRRFLADLKVDFDQAVERKRHGDDKLWFPQVGIDQAIDALKKTLPDGREQMKQARDMHDVGAF